MLPVKFVHVCAMLYNNQRLRKGKKTFSADHKKTHALQISFINVFLLVLTSCFAVWSTNPYSNNVNVSVYVYVGVCFPSSLPHNASL